MTNDNSTSSKVVHYLQILLKQAGITKGMTLEQVQKIFDDEEKAARVDAQLEMPFYNQSKLSFQRLSKKGNTVLITCKPAAIKLFLILANYQNQSNVICISKQDLSEMSEMSKPTIRTATTELVYKGLMIIDRGDERQGEAITYILNPECLASGKLIYHKSLVHHYWERAGEDAKKRFDNILRHAEAQFSAKFQIEDVTIRGEVERQAKLMKKGKKINQYKKNSVSAGHTDTIEQSTQGSTTNQGNDKQSTTENQEKSVAAFNMQNELLTAEENELFSPEGDKQPGNPAYSIHNNTKEE